MWKCTLLRDSKFFSSLFPLLFSISCYSVLGFLVTGCDEYCICYLTDMLFLYLVTLTEGKISDSRFSGQLSVFLDNWRKVCTKNFDNNDAIVACRELGFQQVVVLKAGKVEFSSQYVTNLECHGNETSIRACNFTLSQCSYLDGTVRLMCFNGDGNDGNNCFSLSFSNTAPMVNCSDITNTTITKREVKVLDLNTASQTKQFNINLHM